VITSSGTAGGTVGTAFSYQITATNSPTSFGASGLPTGLTVNIVSGLISGTPTGAGTSSVTLSATNSGGTGSAPLTLTVTGPAPTITSLSSSSGAVGAPVTIAGTNFGATQGTSTVTFNGTAASATSWSATSIAATVPSGATTGNVVVTVGGQSSNGVSFTVTVAPPVITSSGTAGGTVGTAFSYQITATNSPTSFGASGLPTGLTVDTVSGLISGTPTAAGTSSVTLSATNSGGTGSAPLTLTVISGGTGPLVSHTIQISSDADDGYYNNQNGTGWHSTPESGGADLVGSWGSLTTAWVTGYRFPSVGANSGDTIQLAHLQMVSSDGNASSVVCGSAPCPSSNYTFRVYGVAQDDGPAFSGAAGNSPLDVPYTTAYTDYTTTGPGDLHGSCQGQNNGQNTCTHTIDVTNIVSEITSRPGWTNTSAMRFVMLSTDSNAPNVYAGYEDYHCLIIPTPADCSGPPLTPKKAATLAVNPPVPTIVSSGAWGTSPGIYPLTYTVGPFVYPGASTLLLFLGDYYNFSSLPVPQPTVSDSCGNIWNILAGPTNWAGFFYDMRSTVYYVQNPASCPAGATITVTTSIQEPIFLHFLAIAGSDTVNAPIVSAITSPSPGTDTTSASSDSITLTKTGLLVSWIFGDSDAPHVFTPQAGFITDLNSTPNYLTTVFESVSSPGSYQSQFSISPSDGWQVLIIGLQAP
jgi:IPT/TIG domain/Putative Ig domain